MQSSVHLIAMGATAKEKEKEKQKQIGENGSTSSEHQGITGNKLLLFGAILLERTIIRAIRVVMYRDIQCFYARNSLLWLQRKENCIVIVIFRKANRWSNEEEVQPSIYRQSRPQMLPLL